MTANRMPACLQQLIDQDYEHEFPRGFHALITADERVVGIHFYDALHYPYENLGLSSTLYVAWRGQATPIPAPIAIDPETGLPWPTPYTYAADYDDRVAAAVSGIRRLEADYQRLLNERNR